MAAGLWESRHSGEGRKGKRGNREMGEGKRKRGNQEVE